MTRGSREWTLWIVAAAAALHATEELLGGWQAWARETLGIAMPTGIFVVVNLLLVALAVRQATVGWRDPVLSLVVPAATLVNGILFHIVPTLLQGRPVPGVYTAALLYLPFSSGALIGAARDGVPRPSIAVGAIAGTCMMLGMVLAARLLTGT